MLLLLHFIEMVYFILILFHSLHTFPALGKHSKECNKRILHRLMSDLCAKNFNWKGQNGKSALSQSSLKEVGISKSFYLSYGHLLNFSVIFYFAELSI